MPGRCCLARGILGWASRRSLVVSRWSCADPYAIFASSFFRNPIC
jgi:hypothetical protein